MKIIIDEDNLKHFKLIYHNNLAEKINYKGKVFKIYHYAEFVRAEKILKFLEDIWFTVLEEKSQSKIRINLVTKFVKYLGFPINKTSGSYTGLNLSIIMNNFIYSEILVNLGADLNIRDRHHNTPLTLAVSKEQFELVKLLVSKGANIYYRNAGLNSVDLAYKYNFKCIGDYLKKVSYNICTLKLYYTTGQIHGRKIKNSTLDTNCCLICTENYYESKPVILLHGMKNPKHNMCVKCFNQLTKTTCPFCRQNISLKKQNQTKLNK